MNPVQGVSLGLLTTVALTGCGPKCDLEGLEAGWSQLGSSPTLDQTLGLLGETCPAAPESLLAAGSDTQVESLASVMQCAGAEQAMTTTGDVSRISVRESLWKECQVESLDLGTQSEFTWSTGRPDVAVALSTFLQAQGASAALVKGMASTALGDTVLPSADGYSPLVLPDGAALTSEPASATLASGGAARVAASDQDRFDGLRQALESQETLTLVGLSSDGEGFAELTLSRDGEGAVAVADQLSIWLHPGHGVTLFDGEAVFLGDASCSGYTLCETEDSPLDWTVLGTVFPDIAATGSVRVGMVEGDLPLTDLVSLLEILGPERASSVRVASLPTMVPIDQELTATARWLGGLPDESGILDPSLRASKAWKKHASWLDDKWGSYDERHLNRIREWMPENLSEIEDLPLFYPFSGPDILNAVTFFPNQELYVMAGLEPIGSTPQVPTGLSGQGAQGLDALRQQLYNYLMTNYFITWQMLGKRDFDDYTRLGTYAYNSTTTVMMVFLVRSGHELISVRRVTLNAEGAVVDADSLKGGPTAVEIRFRSKLDVIPSPAKEQRMIYFSGDLSDRSMSKTRGLVPFLEGMGQYNSFLKAASYLMHHAKFDDTRSAILNRSHHIIMESSGIPYHFVARDTENWDVRIFGAYSGNIESFWWACQPDLKADLPKKGLGELPFRFGYNRHNFHMIVAKRKTPIVPINPDGSTKLGVDTRYSVSNASCSGGKQNIIERK